MTGLAVLALDAADLELARRWECESLLLADHSQIETYSHSLNYPFTPEVWTTVATGEMPDDHGVTGDAQEWDNPLLRVASRVTEPLPEWVRTQLGRPFRARGAEQTFDRSDSDHPFDDVFGWPGVTPAKHLDQAWQWCDQAEAGDLTDAELQSNIRENTGMEFGWLASAAGDGGLVGVHSHILDVAGHVYCERPERLRAVYEWVDQQVAWLRASVDELVILSDHGMQTTALGDDDPGTHSWRAMIATTSGIPGPHPGHVKEVADWLSGQAPHRAGTTRTETVVMDTATERLSDLGYIDA